MKTIKVNGIDDLIKSLDVFVKDNNKITKFAMNSALSHAQTQSMREAKAGWVGIKVGDFKKGAVSRKATITNPQIKWSLKTKPIPLIYFSAVYKPSLTPTGKKTSGGAGVRYKLKTKKKLKLEDSFIKKSKFGSKPNTVFTRTESPQGADITAHSAITPTSMFAETDSVNTFIEKFEKNFKENYVSKILSFQKKV